LIEDVLLMSPPNYRVTFIQVEFNHALSTCHVVLLPEHTTTVIRHDWLPWSVCWKGIGVLGNEIAQVLHHVEGNRVCDARERLKAATQKIANGYLANRLEPKWLRM
jgi:hypothetical protein